MQKNGISQHFIGPFRAFLRGRLLLLDGIGILVIRLGDALPLAVKLHHQQDIREVNIAAPSFFQYAGDRQVFLDHQHIHTGLEVGVAGGGIHVVIELLDGTMLQHAVQAAKQTASSVNSSFAYLLLPSATLLTNFIAASSTAWYSLILDLMMISSLKIA